MDKALLKICLRRELDLWSAKPYDALATELQDTVAYSVGEGSECYQVEVDRLECTPEYVHVCISVDDGHWRAFVPLTTSFIVHRDWRVEKPTF